MRQISLFLSAQNHALQAYCGQSGVRTQDYTPIEDKFLHPHGLYTHAGEKRIELSVVRR